MSSVWVLMYNVEVTDSGVEYIRTDKEIVRAYQQRATAFAKMEQANAEAGEHDKDGNSHYYSIEEVNYV